MAAARSRRWLLPHDLLRRGVDERDLVFAVDAHQQEAAVGGHGDAMRVRDWRAHGGLDVVAHLVLRSGAADASVLRDVLEARTLMLRELARLAAERRDDAEAARLVELATAFAAAEDPAAAQAIDFAFFSAVAEAARNIVFVLILNAIRDAYFAHADRVPVTADPAELTPRYASLAAAIERGDADAAGATAFELAAIQRAWVEAAFA